MTTLSWLDYCIALPAYVGFISLARASARKTRQREKKGGIWGNLDLQKRDIKILVNLKKVIALVVLNIFCATISSQW